MSTRCLVQVKSTGLGWDEGLISLYHHCDGYPTNMLPLILKARQRDMGEYTNSYRFGRAGHTAAFLCAADPVGFECEANTGLHGDIEWLYLVECRNAKQGSMVENPDWYVVVYRPVDSIETSTLVAEGTIQELARKAKKIEAMKHASA